MGRNLCIFREYKEGKKKVVSYNSTKANIKYCFQCLII